MKGIKFLGALAAASLLFSFSVSAQENNNRDENGKVVRGAYETNKWYDNTFIGVAGGVNTVFDSYEGHPFEIGQFGAAAELNFGKWYTPAIGVRFGWQGLSNEPRDFTHTYEAGGSKTVTFSKWAFANEEQVPFNILHGDFLWNISNSIGGYKETRFWDFVPYMSAGLLAVGADAKTLISNWEYAMGPGLLNVLRLNDRIDLTLDMTYYIVADRDFYAMPQGHVGYGRFIGFPKATVGLAFNLFKTNFDRHSSITPTIIPVPFTLDQYNDLAAKVKALEAENAALKDKIAALEAENAKYKNFKEGQTYIYQNGSFIETEATVATPAIVYFDLGSAKLSQREKAHLDFYAENALDADTELLLIGSADKDTGNARINQKLSEQRCDVVKKYLAGKGINNVETLPEGDTNNMYNTPAKNRSVTVKIK